MFYARNDGKRTIVGNAVPSIAPARASGYFSKTECFCFTAQTLAAGEARDMLVRFIVAPDMPENIHTITLTYTFFKNNELTAQLDSPAGSSVRACAAPCPPHSRIDRQTAQGPAPRHPQPQPLRLGRNPTFAHAWLG